MAAIHDLINQIQDPALRAKIEQEVDKLTKQKKFGLVFEEHLPECTPLYDIPVRKGLKVSVRDGKANETYTVLKVTDGRAVCLPKDGAEAVEFDVADLVTTAELGDPIYETAYRTMAKSFEGKETYQLYRDYLDNFRINTGRN